MKSINVLFAIAALSVSGLAMAEGGAERTLARMEQTRQTAQEAYRLAQQRKGEAPAADSRAQQAGHANC